MGTRSTTPKKDAPVSREEFEAALALIQQQKQIPQNAVFRAWSNFFFAIFSNPATTLAGLGAALPVLTEAVNSQNWVLGVAGLSTLMTGALARDAKKPKPTNDTVA